jgi:hypothetical protein
VQWSKGYTWGNTIYYAASGPKLGLAGEDGFLFVKYLDMFGPGGAAQTDSTGNLIWSDELGVISLAALETSDGGCLVTGNGPIYGVSLSPSDWPQIGLIKTDSTGNSTDCVWGGGFSENPCTISWETPSITATPKGTISQIHPAIINSVDLDTISGCVTVFGSVDEESSISNSLRLFPNPSGGKFSLEFSSPVTTGTILLEVYNCRGEQLCRPALPTTRPVSADLSILPPGIYNIRVIAGDDVFIQRLVICR